MPWLATAGVSAGTRHHLRRCQRANATSASACVRVQAANVPAAARVLLVEAEDRASFYQETLRQAMLGQTASPMILAAGPGQAPVAAAAAAVSGGGAVPAASAGASAAMESEAYGRVAGACNVMAPVEMWDYLLKWVSPPSRSRTALHTTPRCCSCMPHVYPNSNRCPDCCRQDSTFVGLIQAIMASRKHISSKCQSALGGLMWQVVQPGGLGRGCMAAADCVKSSRCCV